MEKRKRVAGGGRKPAGEFRHLSSQMTVRMPDSMRSQLEASTKRRSRGGRKWNVSQELLWRVQDSFNREREKGRDPALKALCYLIGEVAEGVTFPYPMRVPEMRPLWRSNPFLYAAFKSAVARLLDELAPAGEIERPGTLDVSRAWTADVTDPSVASWYQTPETLADFVMAGVLQALKSGAVMRGAEPEVMMKWDSRNIYQMDDARRDLGLKAGEKS